MDNSDITRAHGRIDGDRQRANTGRRDQAEGTATVEVTVSGVELMDPAAAKEKPVPGQGHLHYQVDKGPVVATPSAKLSFHELAPGMHTILVVLAGNDHKPLGPQQQLTVTVPPAASHARHGSEGTPAQKKY